MFKLRTSKFRHVFCDQPKIEVRWDQCHDCVSRGAPWKDVLVTDGLNGSWGKHDRRLFLLGAAEDSLASL